MFFRELRPGFCTRATKYDIGTNNSIKQCATRLEKSDDSARWIAVDENKKCQQSTSGHRRTRVGWHDICGSILFFPFLFSFFFFLFSLPFFFLFLSQWKYEQKRRTRKSGFSDWMIRFLGNRDGFWDVFSLKRFFFSKGFMRFFVWWTLLLLRCYFFFLFWKSKRCNLLFKYIFIVNLRYKEEWASIEIG